MVSVSRFIVGAIDIAAADERQKTPRIYLEEKETFK
jgi:hypothetical protein